MANNKTLETLAALIIAHRAYQDGEVQFADEVLAGCWDHHNRNDIKAVLAILSETPSKVDEFFASVTRRP